MTSWRTTATGVIAIIVAVCGAVTQVLDGEPLDLQALIETIFTAAVGAGLLAARDNSVTSEQVRQAALRKSRASKLPIILMFFAIASGLAACQTIKANFAEELTYPDGTVQQTEYRAISIVPPFGKQDLSASDWEYVWKDGEGSLATGQHAEGTDNTEQAIALATIESMVDRLCGLVEALTVSGATGVPAAVP